LVDFAARMEHVDRNRAEGRLIALLANRAGAQSVEARQASAPATPPDMTGPTSDAIARSHPADTLFASTCKTGRCTGAIAISSAKCRLAVIRQRGKLPFEPREIQKLTALLDHSLARACRAAGEQTCNRGSVSLAAQLERQRIQMLWYPIRIEEIDSALFILGQGTTEQLLVRAVESWRKEHGLHT